jgi:hypothetical protein
LMMIAYSVSTHLTLGKGVSYIVGVLCLIAIG